MKLLLLLLLLSPVLLGRALFFDPRLSIDNRVSCASCHNPNHGFGDVQRLRPGLKRHSQTLWNVKFNPTFFWDGRAQSLEEQMRGPLLSAAEMGMPSMGRVVQKVNGLPGYADWFGRVYGQPATVATLTDAIAAYEKTLVSFDSPYDRYVAGDHAALSPAARRGLDLFMGRANCALCHTNSLSSPYFTDFGFHNTGIMRNLEPAGHRIERAAAHGQVFSQAWPPALGRVVVTGEPADIGAFKTPTLRNVALRAPYMHDGSLPSLSAVLRFYNAGGRANPWLDNKIDTLHLTQAQLDDLEAFLRSLTGRGGDL